jgi:CRISPR-associated endoribonuclease Cas6
VYARFIHRQGYRPPGNEGRRFKMFVYSRLEQEGKRVVGSRQILNNRPVYWQIASPLDDFIPRLIYGLSVQGGIAVRADGCEAFIALAGVRFVEPPAWTDRLRCRTISPIFVSLKEAGAKYKHHLRAYDERFGLRIIANLYEKYYALTGNEADESSVDFCFEQEPRSQLVQFDGTDHKCYLGRFVVRGDPELIRLGWECGFGEGNSKGFGMAEAID